MHIRSISKCTAVLIVYTQHVKGQPYVDPGASALDLVDGPVPVTVSGEVNVNRRGDYTLNYSAVDSAGNRSTAKRVVQVR